jgi:tetratricopeptide (TPR) repeat protein
MKNSPPLNSKNLSNRDPIQKTDPRGKLLFIGLLLAALTFAVYGQMIGHGFIRFDDESYITQNPIVQRGLSMDGLVWAFSSPHVYNWHPLTWLSHMVDVQLFGLKAGGHHLMSLLFHIVNTLLLFLILRAMTGSLWRSAAVAALFALHPLHVESVVWASERKDVLSTLFYLLTLWFYLQYVKQPGFRRYWPVLFCYAAGLLAKQMAVTLPFLLLLLDYWPLGRLLPADATPAVLPQPEALSAGITRKRKKNRTALPAAAVNRRERIVPSGVDWSRLIPLVREKLPLFALAAAASIMIFLVQSETGIVKSAMQYPLSARMENAVFSYAAYLVKTIFPIHLAIFYPHPGTALPFWQVGGAALLILLITVFVLRAGRPYLVTGWFWYLGTLVPVIGLVQVGLQGMADRYTYVPLIGIFMIIAWGLPELAAERQSRKAILIPVAAAGLCVLTILTWFQVGTWRDDITLYSHAAEVTSGNDWAEYNLGLSLAGEGRFDEALPHFQEAIRIRPGYADAYLNIGVIQALRGNLDGASANFTRVLEIQPDHVEARRNFALTLLRRGDLDGAASHIRILRQSRPNDPESWFLTGLLSTKQGNPAEAESAYAQAIRLRPDYAEAQNNLGILLARQGRIEAAIGRFREALRIRPDYREAEKNLENALSERGKNR